MSETGIATTGTSAERNEPRKRKMTTTTMSSVSRRVLTTSRMALRMYAVPSYAMVALICSGSSFCKESSSTRTRLMTSREFALGRDQTPMKTAVCPLKFTAVS